MHIGTGKRHNCRLCMLKVSLSTHLCVCVQTQVFLHSVFVVSTGDKVTTMQAVMQWPVLTGAYRLIYDLTSRK